MFNYQRHKRVSGGCKSHIRSASCFGHQVRTGFSNAVIFHSMSALLRRGTPDVKQVNGATCQLPHGIKCSGCGKPTMSGGSNPPPPTTWAVAKCMLVYQTKGFRLPVREARNLGEGLTPASPGKEAGVFDFVLQSFHCLIFRGSIPHSPLCSRPEKC